MNRPSPRTVNQSPAVDQFVNDNPGPARAAAAVKSAEGPLMARAADHAPVGEALYLKDIEGHEVQIHNIMMPYEDSFGPSTDILVLCEGEEEAILVHVSGFLAGRLIGLRDKIEAGECSYPMAARFDKIGIKGGKTVWSMT